MQQRNTSSNDCSETILLIMQVSILVTMRITDVFDDIFYVDAVEYDELLACLKVFHA